MESECSSPEPWPWGPLVTSTIWVNESITEYFAELLLVHAGLKSREDFLSTMAGPNPTLEMMLANVDPTTDVSRAAVRWRGMQDMMPFMLRMYMQGPRTMFALDMEMRRGSEGEIGVLDLVHHLHSEYAQKGIGFPEEGVLEIINEVAGGDLSDFYNSFIDGDQDPDSMAALDVIGYEADDGGVVESLAPSPSQLEAREDFFSIDG